VQLALAIVLARLLTPAEFGVMAVASVILAVSNTLVGGGFGVALVQKRDLTPADTSSVFYLGLGISFLMAAALTAVAPWIAAFFGMPVLEPVARVLSLTFIISSLGGVHTSLLAKHLKFGALARISLSASVVSSLVAVVLAWQGFGIWSLVGQTLVATTVTAVVVWFVSDWRPSPVFSFSALRPLFRFGAFIVAADLLETVFGRIYTLLIGKFYTASDLGFYSRAESTLALPNNFTSGIINQVAMPLFAAAAHDAELLQRAFRKAMRVTFYVHAPIIAGLFVTAEPLILTLFGPKWAPSIPYLQILAFIGLCWLPVTVNYGYLKATGRSKAYFYIELTKKIIFLVVAVVTVQISITAMLVGSMVFNLVAYLITARVSGARVGFTGSAQIRESWKPLFSAFCMVPVAGAPSLFWSLPSAAALCIQLVLGAGFYLTFCGIIKCREQDEVFAYVRGALRKIVVP
jgi:teichuronic acid exporter